MKYRMRKVRIIYNITSAFYYIENCSSFHYYFIIKLFLFSFLIFLHFIEEEEEEALISLHTQNTQYSARFSFFFYNFVKCNKFFSFISIFFIESICCFEPMLVFMFLSNVFFVWLICKRCNTTINYADSSRSAKAKLTKK